MEIIFGFTGGVRCRDLEDGILYQINDFLSTVYGKPLQPLTAAQELLL